MIQEKLSIARYRLCSRYPYYATAAQAMTPVVTEAVPTAAVDKYWRAYVNPKFLLSISEEELVGVLMHELQHLLREHSARAEEVSADPTRWNIAADAEINDDLRGARLLLPSGAVYPEDIASAPGRLAEEYYWSIPVGGLGASKDGPGARDNAPAQQGAKRAGSAGRAGSSQASSPSADASAPGDSGAGDPLPDCGSGAHGQPRPWEAPDPSTPEAPPGVTKAEAASIRRRTAEEICRAADLGRGSVPGWARRWADEIIRPSKTSWRRLLSIAVRGALRTGTTDYSYRRPSRRQSAWKDIILPGMVSRTPEVGVIVDTSASVSDIQLSEAVAEVCGIVRAAGARVDVYGADAEVTVHVRAAHARDVARALVGGGGTNMSVAIQQVEKNKHDVIVVVTDGDTPWPKEKPKTPVIVALLPGCIHRAPEWAKEVRIER
ncbi:MAG: vWA domain-containing protein [bacterium JZ-2024 1]